MKFLNKKGVSFGAIIATIGSILIALGFAWLIAQNWHIMPDAVKIILMIVLTASAFTAGVLLGMKGYPLIGKSFNVLGALLYTLSIFLIAQTFNFDATIQGTANLLLLAWIGVTAAAYILDTSVCLIVALIEFLVWISIQFISFVDSAHSYEESIFGMMLLTYLAVGIFLYGLYLIHKSKSLRFAKVYQWWTAFYFLMFAYIISFQALLPMIWSEGFKMPQSPLMFILVLSLLAVIAFIFGLIISLDNKSVSKWEIIGVVSAIVLLIVTVLISGMVTINSGDCYSKSCYSFSSKDTCEEQAELGCTWIGAVEDETAASSCKLKKVDGKISGGYEFNDNTYITIKDNDDLDIQTNKITLSAWINQYKFIDHWTSVIWKSYSDMGWGYSLGTHPPDKEKIRAHAMVANCLEIYSNYTFNYNEWHHIAATYDGSELKLYVDGKLRDSATKDCSFSDSSYDVFIGRFRHSQPVFFPGMIDDARIFNRALSASEVKSLYEGKSIDMKGNVLWLKLDEPQGSTTFKDSSGNGNDGKCSIATSPKTRENYCSTKEGVIYQTFYQEKQKECMRYTDNKDKCTERSYCTWSARPYFYSFFGHGRHSAPASIWALWILANLVFLGLILAVIGYGTWIKETKIINLGIVFFVLDILTRYIGFVIEYYRDGYTYLAIIFITSGIILLFGGWGVEKWRRNLVKKARSS